MRKIKGTLGILLFGLVGLASTSHAALNDLGNGLVNDDVLNITWMQDANLVGTACTATSGAEMALWDAFDPTVVASNSGRTKTAICTANGTLNWFEAEAWIAVLNTQSYLGFTDWRQPVTPQPDLTCESTFAAGNNGGYNCTGSELGNLFNVSLANPNDSGTGTGLDGSTGTAGTACFGIAPHCFQTTAPFSNAQSFAYWSGSSFAPNTGGAWNFNTDDGSQDSDGKVNDDLFVWPVRSGQSVVAPATPVPTLSLWGLGIMSLLLGFVARRKVR